MGERLDCSESKTSTVIGRPRSVEDLTRRNVEIIAQLEGAAQERRTGLERVIDRVSAFCGNPWFLWIHLAWFVLWIGVNVLPGVRHFDPYPYQFLTLVVSLEAILLSTFILITQNRQAVVADRRNHLDLQINLLSEQENTKMLLLLDRMARKMGIDECDDPEVRIMEEAARPERLVEQIEETLEARGREEQEEEPLVEQKRAA
jgi:uncharacterized membrane protein